VSGGEEDLLRLGAFELAARVRAGELSPVELVERHVRRIERVNPSLNALTGERFAEARAEARRAAQAVREGAPLGPLHGVPFTVKEMLSVEGMPNTMGTLGRRGRVGARDAEVVRRLRAAGAILLGVSNVPEWGFWFETDNPIYGRTSNPFDLSRTPGGSSGGEGALVGSGASVFGIGSDIGGSVRMPSAFCGVFGHKPTPGLIPLTGHYPVEYEESRVVPGRSPYLAIGPLTRTARDLMPLLRILAGPDGRDPNAEPIPLGRVGEVRWEGRTVHLLDDPEITLARRASPEVRRAARRAAAALARRGARVEPLPRDLFRDAVEIWAAALGAQDGPSFGEVIGARRLQDLLRSLLLLPAGRASYSLPVLLFALLERISHRSGDRLRAALEQQDRLRERIEALLAPGAVLLLPPHPRPAPRHHEPLLHPFDFAYTAIMNALRLPVTAVPLGCNARGLPLGVQVAAAHGQDHLCIAAALALEAAVGPWAPAQVRGVEAPRAPGRDAAPRAE
jgi:fatty acid amide hydrolase 2